MDEAEARCGAIRGRRRAYPFWVELGAYFLGAAFFTLFFGGTVLDALCGRLCGLSIALCLTFLARLRTNLFFKTVAGGAVSALLALGLCLIGLGKKRGFYHHRRADAAGASLIFTNAMRDIMAGDTIGHHQDRRSHCSSARPSPWVPAWRCGWRGSSGEVWSDGCFSPSIFCPAFTPSWPVSPSVCSSTSIRAFSSAPWAARWAGWSICSAAPSSKAIFCSPLWPLSLSPPTRRPWPASASVR